MVTRAVAAVARYGPVVLTVVTVLAGMQPAAAQLPRPVASAPLVLESIASAPIASAPLGSAPLGSAPLGSSGTAPVATAVTPGSILARLASATITPAQAVSQAHSQAAANGINDYLSVVDRSTGALLAQSGSGTQVASESIMKLMLASYYLVLAGGYQHQSADVLSNLSYMIRYSDDDTANAYFSSAAIPTIAARYGMRSTINATDRTGHWGAARITAADMTTFLFRASRDAQVGPWLLPVMAQVAPVGSDGFNQAFGMNSLGGTHGSKQGWGGDQFWTSASNVINSVGYTDRYFVAILQNSYSYPDPARSTSTSAARTIAAARTAVAAPPAPPVPVVHNGDFVRRSGDAAVYRVAGGAPIYVHSWVPFGGSKPVKVISSAQFAGLRVFPVDGTFITATGTGEVYRVVYGTPVYVARWSRFGGIQDTIVVDAAAIINAGHSGVWSHLRSMVPDGSYLVATGTNEVFKIAGGAPTYVSSWAAVGGPKIAQRVDQDSITNAGHSGRWSHLGYQPRNGTYLSVNGSTAIYRTAGGAPLYVASFAGLDGSKVTVQVDVQAVNHGGQTGRWAHLGFYPTTGTLLTGDPGGRVYRVSSGHAVYVPSWSPYGGPRPTVRINQLTIDRAGLGGVFNHLRR